MRTGQTLRTRRTLTTRRCRTQRTGPAHPTMSPAQRARRTRTPLRENLSNAGTEAIRVRLDVGYDGSGFSGWARQPGRRTVQETLEGALARVLRLPEPPALTVAGRTDAGVHARGQAAPP